MEHDEQFLEHIVKALADHPEDVKITRTVDEMGVLLTLVVNQEDMGKIIGRSGATAKAIRTILRVVGMKNDARVNLKIEEPEGSIRPTKESHAQDDDMGTIADIAPREAKVREEKSLDDMLDSIKV